MCTIGTYTSAVILPGKHIRSKWLQYDEIWHNINGSNYEPTALSIQK